ncbi:hypothetical protein CL614_01970 [archaeon]|nr:hypothetical protein [archaeon]
MKNLTIGVFGNKEFINDLGKKATVNDIAIHHHWDSTHVFTFVAPNSEKIQPLLQSLQMIDIPLLVLTELNPQVGEEIVGINEMGFDKGFVILDGVLEDSYKSMIKDTTLEKFEIIEKDIPNVYEKLMLVDVERGDDVLVPIDNSFAVKGVGTVILGLVKSGIVKKYDKLILEPEEKEVTIKGIQIQDKDFDEAAKGSRVGLNLKDVTIEELRRGQVLSSVSLEKSMKLGEIKKNTFYTGDVKDNEQVIISSGLQCVTGIKNGNDIDLDRKMVLQQPIIVASTKQENLRIIGKI